MTTPQRSRSSAGDFGRGSGWDDPLTVEVQGRIYIIEVAGTVVRVEGGVFSERIDLDLLTELLLSLDAAADEIRRGGTGSEDTGVATASCPRCGEVSEGAYSAQSCSLCGHAWRTAPDDDFDVGPRGAGGAR